MEQLSDLDVLFMAGETASQHLHVLATLILDRSDAPSEFDYKVFRSHVAERFQMIEPLRRRLMRGPLTHPVWIDDDDIHLDRHLHHIVLANGGGLDALAGVAAEIASFPLPTDRPPWEAWFVEGVSKDDVAVIAKIHHSAADGLSGIFALAAFFDLEPSPAAGAGPPPWQPSPAPGFAELGRATLGNLWHRPEAVVRSLRRVGASTVDMVRSRADTPLPFTGPRQPYNRALTPRRSVAFATIPLDEIEQIRQGFGVSVNDVVVAVCAGALRRYALLHGEEPTRPLVAGVPISERRPEHGSSGNQISFMLYSLPVDRDGPALRLEEVTRSATAAKDLYARSGSGLMGSIATLAPSRAVGPVMRAISGMKIADIAPPVMNVFISNIHGPDLPLYAAGARLRAMFPMGPLIEGVGLGVTIVSHADEAALGFMGCEDHVPDIEVLADYTGTEVEALLDAVPTAPR